MACWPSPPLPPLGILTSLHLCLPGEIKAFPCTCSHVISEWAGFVSSWALGLPRKAPSVLFLPRRYRAVGGGIRGKINKIKKRKKFIIKTPRINGVRRLTVLNGNSSSPVPVSGLPPWHLTNRGSQGTINSATVLIPVGLLKLFRDGLVTVFVFPSTLWAPVYRLINWVECEPPFLLGSLSSSSLCPFRGGGQLARLRKTASALWIALHWRCQRQRNQLTNEFWANTKYPALC